jgi:ketosteroid isomerase-like protein
MSTPRSVIEDHYAASARGDLDGMVAPFADGIVWTDMDGFPYAGTYRGADAVPQGGVHAPRLRVDQLPWLDRPRQPR